MTEKERVKVMREKRVGIMTMHRVKNSGSFLQAYGLKKVVESLDCNVEFVDFELKLLHEEEKNSFLYENCYFLWKFFHDLKIRMSDGGKEKLAQENSIRRFHFKYVNEYLPELMGGKAEENYTPELDTLVIGSDEVFNLAQYAEEYEIPYQLVGEDNNADRLISYAASFGHTTKEDIEKYFMTNKLTGLLKKFDAVSVRDENSFNIISELTGNFPATHIDPVLLHDFNEIKYERPEKEPYILVYAYSYRIDNLEEINAIQAFAKAHNLRIICVNEVQQWCENKRVCNPLKILSYFKYADYVITDTFHGTILSIKYHKQFGVIVRNSNKQKIVSLLKQFGLGEQHIQNMEELDSIVSKVPDYDKFEIELKKEREKAIEYLQFNI